MRWRVCGLTFGSDHEMRLPAESYPAISVGTHTHQSLMDGEEALPMCIVCLFLVFFLKPAFHWNQHVKQRLFSHLLLFAELFLFLHLFNAFFSLYAPRLLLKMIIATHFFMIQKQFLDLHEATRLAPCLQPPAKMLQLPFNINALLFLFERE